MKDEELIDAVALMLCQHGRITRDMPGLEELRRALPQAKSLVSLVRKNTPSAEARPPAWQLGYDAYHGGKSELACPFGRGEADRTYWLTGFAEARDESRHETNGTSPAEGE